MKLIPIAILLFGLPLASFAQPYFCDAPDSVLAKYRDDADRMAIDRTFQNGSTWMDSVNINPEWSQTALGALVAVYNSTSPERDTVVDLLDMHIYPTIPLRKISILANSSLAWIPQLEAGNVPTGNTALDELMQQYGVTAYAFPYTTPGSPRSIFFTTSTNCNTLALADRFDQLPGVIYAGTSGAAGDGNRITDSLSTDHIEITFGYGWGDCPAGCGARHYWKFNVGPDCEVDFVESYGTPMFIPTVINKETLVPTRAWPNPTSDRLFFNAPAPKGRLQVQNLDGRTVQTVSYDEDGVDVSSLPSGIYLLRQLDQPEAAPFRFVVTH